MYIFFSNTLSMSLHQRIGTFVPEKEWRGERTQDVFIKGEKYLKGGVDTMEDRMSQEKINESAWF